MAANLFIIEAPGKRRALADVLRRSGMRDLAVLATMGHIAGNPAGLRPLGINRQFQEREYALRSDKLNAAAQIRDAAAIATRIYIATDDDQEGDVIARDVVAFCIAEPDQLKVLRCRLRALAVGEVREALETAAPLDALASARGDARRVVDRLIGSLSSDAGAVGRVQGSTLIKLADRRPVAGVMTYTLGAADGLGDWVAKEPVYAGQDQSGNGCIAGVAAVGRSQPSTLAARGMGHDQILLTASLETDATIGEVSDAMQRLYESGKLSYPRGTDQLITRDAFRRVMAIARANGAGFDADRFSAERTETKAHAHEAPNPVTLDVPLNRTAALLSLDDQVLVHITRNLVSCGLACQRQTPRLSDLAGLPLGAQNLRWHRDVPSAERLWSVPAIAPGFRAWTPEQSLLHFMSKFDLGRPSTVVQHVEKFLARGLVSPEFEFTNKGRDWHQNVGEIFGHKNVSQLIENYLENQKKAPPEMVADMIALCGLGSYVETVITELGPAEDEKTHEISAGVVP